MSPLARSLLALAAAALLLGASAKLTTNDQCTIAESGFVDDGRPVELPYVPIPAGVQDAVVDIPYGCHSDEYMSGERVTVCDDRKPVVVLPPWPQYSPATVHRTGAYWDHAADVFVTQFCKTK